VSDVIYIDKNGKKKKKPPKGVPPFKPKPVVNGEGCSPKNGIPVLPKLERQVRKRAKKV